MITREQLENALGDSKDAFQTKGIDHDMTAMSLLRKRIPYDNIRSIIGGAEHDVLYLCDIKEVLPFLEPEDLTVLADCNMCIDKDQDCLFLFV